MKSPQLESRAGLSEREVALAIRRALPQLDSVKGKTRDYRRELQTLHHWLNILQAEKATGLTISMVGEGKWWALTGTPGHLAPINDTSQPPACSIRRSRRITRPLRTLNPMRRRQSIGR